MDGKLYNIADWLDCNMSLRHVSFGTDLKEYVNVHQK